MGQVYSDGVPEHHTKNCTGCHMADTQDVVAGGHTFRPKLETCRECHAGIPDFLSVIAPADIDGDPATASVYQSLGTINVNLEPSPNDTGLFNILRYEFYKVGIDYDPNTYPYFFKKVLPYSLANHTNANGFKNWTAAQFTAAFNLGQIYKTGNAAYVHNYYYTAQILIDSLRSIGVTTNPKTGNPFVRPTSPTGGTTHQATDYRTIVIP
ncbi:MAG: hypothetical protein KC910_11665 [Candidatus Eremiobacteraeota bacterium]|nr:hypothetical protein [Candidatus Eremiobacteraeota bacterium]